MMLEKFEDCPKCGAFSPKWHYDFQRCDRCGLNRMAGFASFKMSPQAEAMLRERVGVDPVAQARAEGERAGRAAEREACAELVEGMKRGHGDLRDEDAIRYYNAGFADAAAAIRARAESER